MESNGTRMSLRSREDTKSVSSSTDVASKSSLSMRERIPSGVFMIE